MYHVDSKYMLLQSSRLRNFKQKGDHLWNSSCPVCGDSQSNVRRARMYFFRRNNGLFVRCHNCQYSASFSRFLQYLDPAEHKNYTYEKFLANRPMAEGSTSSIDLPPQVPPERLRTAQALSIPSIADLAAGHYAKAYIASRKVPEQYWSELYFAENYKAFLDKDFPDHGKEDLPADGRIVIPFMNEDNYITYITGRAILNKSSIRYVTVKILDEKKVYGLNRLDSDSPFYVVEGPLDSLFLPNAVAAGDANLLGVAEHLRKLEFTRGTIVFDNEPRSKEITTQMQKAIELGYKVAILPHNDRAKDINDLVNLGWSLSTIRHYIDAHSYLGNFAMLEFVKWRRT